MMENMESVCRNDDAPSSRRNQLKEAAYIGLYRDVWIIAIASSRMRLVTLSVVMCNTSQCKLRSLRVNSGMGNVI